MSGSQVEIVNIALQKCGEATIDTMSQDTRAAREASKAWEQVRKATIRMYRWNFARGRAQLAASATGPLMGFTYQCPVPADFLGLIGVWEDGRYQQQYTGTQTPYVTENTDNQRVILTNSAPIYIHYIKNVTDTSQFDPLFDQVLSCHLALQLQYPLSLGIDRVAEIAKELQYWEKKAKFSNAIESLPERIESSEWIDSRYAGDTILRRGPVA